MNGKRKQRLLIVDDDVGVVEYLVEMLEQHGYAVQGLSSPIAALERIENEAFDLLIADMVMPEMSGLQLLEALRQIRPELRVLFITAFGSIELAVRAVREGACNFVAKPFPIEQLLVAIEQALREQQLQQEIERLRSVLGEQEQVELAARSPSMRKVVELARRVARSDSTVLLTGESGSGKGWLARYIHEQSPRAESAFVQVNCAAMPGPLIESELFGVRRGAFTGADQDRGGMFVEADGGTLLLDEIGELALEFQPKLLHALENERVRPLGAADDVPVDVRVIAATNRPLEDLLRERRFRPDLYYRLNVIRIVVPPLRERREDIEPLARALLQRACARLNRPAIDLSLPALRWLCACDWPGNVRELANTLERALILAEEDCITPDFLSCEGGGECAEKMSLLRQAAAENWSLADFERAYIRDVLKSTNGNKAQAARILKIDRRTLYNKIADG